MLINDKKDVFNYHIIFIFSQFHFMNDCFERLKEEAIMFSKGKKGIPVEQESRLDQSGSDENLSS